MTATDQDLGDARRVTYSITDDVPFRIDSSTGEIFTTRTLDYEEMILSTYSFMVTASDHGDPPQSSQVVVSVRVSDVNEESPEFITLSTGSFVVEEGSEKGALIETVMARDSDRDAVLVYFFAPPVPACYFDLNNVTGEIRLKVSANDPHCVDGTTVETAEDPQYIVIRSRVVVSDGDNEAILPLSFTLHNSLCVTCVPVTELPIEIIAASVTGALAVIFIFICILIFACVCRARRTGKIEINDAPGQSIELQKRFGSGRSSNNNTPGPVYKQTSIPLEHTTMNIPRSAGGSGASSTRQSFVCGDADTDQSERNSYPTPGKLSKPYRSTSDLGSSMVATDMLSGESQETAPYPKAQIDKIYAKNADLLQSDSNESIHMFGSEGGGESDGGDDMLFAKFDDLDDDDDSTMMQDDEDDRNYQQRSLSNSRDNLSVPPVMDDPYNFNHPASNFDHRDPMWAPRADSMAETIEQMAINSYEPEDHMRRGGPPTQHYMNEFNKSQEGVSMYGTGSTQESVSRGPLLRHTHQPPHQQTRIPPQHIMQPGGHPDFYPFEESPRLHGNARVLPKYGPSAGLPMYPAHNNIPRGHRRHDGPAGGGGASQEAYGYGDYLHHHHPMHLGGNHSPSSSTPTEGTLNTRATTNDYESDLMYSSDTSLNTNTEDPPHLRGFSQSGHSQRHGYH